MNLDTNALLALPAAEKLELIELLWDNLGESTEEIPLPQWAEQEAIRRRDEMNANATSGMTHQQVWQKIHGRTK